MAFSAKVPIPTQSPAADLNSSLLLTAPTPTPALTSATATVYSSVESEDIVKDLPDTPLQPRNIIFPKRQFGDKFVTLRSFLPSWFDTWKFLHYEVESVLEAAKNIFVRTGF